MDVLGDVAHVIHALQNALKILQDRRAKRVAPAKSVLGESYENLLENYCNSKGIRWSRTASEAHTKVVFHMHADYFKLDINIVSGTVTDAWIQHQLGQNHPEACPHLARIIRLKSMENFDQHITGYLKMYTFSLDKSQRPHFYLSLSKLEADYLTVFQQIQKSNTDAIAQVLNAPCGLLSPRRDGIPLGICFFVVPMDLIDRGKQLENSFYVLAGRRLGTWASVSVKDAKAKFALPASSLLRNVSTTPENTVLCEFAPLDTAHMTEIHGYFTLDLDKPLLTIDSNIDDLRQITGIDVLTNAAQRPRWYMEQLEDSLGSSTWKKLGAYETRIGDQHHSYVVGSTDLRGRFVTEIPFTHPSQVGRCLLPLRRQVALNKLLSSCIRPPPEHGVFNPFKFNILAGTSKTAAITVEFEHPLTSATCRVEMSLQDPVSPVCRFLDRGTALCSDELLSKWIKRVWSIPIVLKCMIDHFVKYYSPTGPRPSIEIKQATIDRSISLEPSPPPIQAPPTPPSAPVLPPESPSRPVEKAPSTPQPVPSPSIPPLTVKIPKIEKLLTKHNRASISPKEIDVPMDPDTHLQKMQQLYGKTKKTPRAARVDYDEGGDDELDMPKPKKRKQSLEPPSPFYYPKIEQEPAEVLRHEPTVIKIKNEDSPHGSPTITLKLPVKPPSVASEAPTLQSLILSTTSRREKKRAKAEAAVEVSKPESKKMKKDPSELEALLMKKPALVPSTSAPSTSTKSSKHSSKHTPSASPQAATTVSSKISSPAVVALITAKSQTPPVTTTAKSALFSVTSSSSKLSSFSERPAKSPAPPSGSAKSPAPPSSKSPTPGAKLHESSSKKSTLSPVKSSRERSLTTSTPPSKISISLSTSTAKSPVPLSSSSTAPLFSVPKMPSLSSLPRIPKKSGSATASTTTSSPTGNTTKVTVASASTPPILTSTGEPSQVAALLMVPAATPRPPLLPTPDMEPLPVSSAKSASDKRDRGRSLLPTPKSKFDPSAAASQAGTERLSPRSAEKPAPITLVEMKDESGEEGRKDGSSGSGPLGATTPPATKGRHKSLSSILERLKSRVEPSDNSHDSTDSQDPMMKGSSGLSDVSDGKENGDSMTTAAGGTTEALSTSVGEIPKLSGRDSNADIAAAPVPETESHPVKSTSAAEKPKSTGLVPYSSGDSSSSESEEDKKTNKAPAAPSQSQRSPEILERPPAQAPSQTTPEKKKALTVTTPSSTTHVEERTSPVILDDALLDAAFFASEEKY